MTTIETTALARREGRPLQERTAGKVARRPRGLPEYLEALEVDALLRCAHDVVAGLLMLIQWRSGLRISEALALTVADLSLTSDRPTLIVRRGKGNKPRRVPVHPELRGALQQRIAYAKLPQSRRLIEADPSTGWRWVQRAYGRAVLLGLLPEGKALGTHTLRHSAARHWLMHGIPINVVSRWLGHARLQTTLIYLEVLPDPLGEIERVP